jgi:hypothetical protein
MIVFVSRPRDHAYLVGLVLCLWLLAFSGCGSSDTGDDDHPSRVAAPQFSPAAGGYSAAQTVTITSSTSGATIRYTTDGSTPTDAVGTVYAAPVEVAQSLTLKAVAYRSGWTTSAVTSGDYSITAPGPVSYCYVANAATPSFSIRAFTINDTTGALTNVPGSPFAHWRSPWSGSSGRSSPGTGSTPINRLITPPIVSSLA